MRNLFLFLWKYNFFIFFLLVESLCGYIIFQNNNYQRTTFVNSTNAIAAKVNTAINSVTEYINLRSTNDALARENAALKSILPDVFYIDSALQHISGDTIRSQQYAYMTAKVINNSTNRRNNYLTLNKGSKQGVRPEMGVISSDGMVGIVKDVSDHYSSVISFLHKDARISARLKNSGYIGSMVWDGFDETRGNLKDIAKHVKVSKGDTIITSSFSAVFPEGVPIGIVESVNPAGGNNFQEIVVKLSTPFGKLSYVFIVSNLFKEEQRVLEEPLKSDK
jgi:rod shape-determining protein MreC